MPEHVRYAYPKYKVFIFGVDVSNDVVAINTNYHDGASPNTCQITLLNEEDKYIITTNDMMVLNKKQSSTNKLNIPWLKKRSKVDPKDELTRESTAMEGSGLLDIDSADFINSVNSGITSQMKRDILLKKSKVVQAFGPKRLDIFNRPIIITNFTDYYGYAIHRYPLVDGAPIFHPMDPVRVFMRDPFDPARWYHHFAGFVSDMVDNTDQNNVKTLTVTAEDPTKLFRYTRVFINPGIVDAGKVIDEGDLKVQSFHQHFFRGYSLPEIFFTLIFGPDHVGAEKIVEKMNGPNKESNISTRLRGIGHFAFDASGIFTFGPEPDIKDKNNETVEFKTILHLLKPEIQIDSLQTWQSIIDHEVQPSDLWTMATEEDRLYNADDIINRRMNGEGVPRDLEGKIDVEYVIQYIGEHPEEYLVDGGRLLMLIPNSLGVDNRKVVIEDIIQAYPLNSEWHSAGQILFEVIDRIQFVMYCTPKGDIVIEPPLYDFDPDDFGLEPITSDAFINLIPSTAKPGANMLNINVPTEVIISGETLAPGRPRGPYGPNYVVLRRDTYNWESAFIDEKVYTAAVIPKQIFQNWESLPNTSIIGDLIVVKIPDIIPLYGIRQIPITPRGYITSNEGAHLFAQITLNKLNADAHTIKIDHLPNIKLGLNRPLYIQGRNCIGTLKQITQSITWGASGDMSTSSDIYAVRTWAGQFAKDDPTQPIYTPIGGYGSRPLNYAVLFRKAPPPKDKDTGLTPFDNKAFTKGIDDMLDKMSNKISDVMQKQKDKIKKIKKD
jgi:hypothetical protein